MRCLPVRVVSLKTREPLDTSGVKRAHAQQVPAEGEATLDAACVKDGNFCHCWMPAWFYLAERVGQERLSAAALELSRRATTHGKVV
jgi:hypothetical protein